eukprot:1144359-Pyramimonas_sp.AAC.1
MACLVSAASVNVEEEREKRADPFFKRLERRGVSTSEILDQTMHRRGSLIPKGPQSLLTSPPEEVAVALIHVRAPLRERDGRDAGLTGFPVLLRNAGRQET